MGFLGFRPRHPCQEETLSTLDYAHRAKNIRNRPEVRCRGWRSSSGGFDTLSSFVTLKDNPGPNSLYSKAALPKNTLKHISIALLRSMGFAWPAPDARPWA